jgi:hypothetical protein
MTVDWLLDIAYLLVEGCYEQLMLTEQKLESYCLYMEITHEDLRKALADDQDIWTFGNNVLYQLCRDYPEHTKADVIVAKIWLIGRSYAAAIERRKLANKEILIANDYFYKDVVASTILSSQIDEKLKALQCHSGINDKSINDVLSAHKYLVDVFRKITGHNKRSLASQYLHFHRPELFFIYDSLASTALGKLKPRHKPSRNLEGYVDETYAGFTLKLLDVSDDIEQSFDKRLTPRQLDRLLLSFTRKFKELNQNKSQNAVKPAQ